MDDSSSTEWAELGELFAAALERPAAQRAEFLRDACDDRLELRRQLESLIASHEECGEFLAELDSQAAGSLLVGGEVTVEPGGRVGPYRVLRELGRGGMAVVYLAERADGQFEQQVALKLIKRGMDSEEILSRFLRERQILARLEHPNIARLVDGGLAADSRPYFALEYVDGSPITDYCDAHELGTERRLHLFLEACEAVQYAHGRLVVHRDLKPSNILVSGNGSPKLLDFGIAKLLAGELSEATTLTGLGRPMTPAYAAPEQILGEEITTATDIYSLGLVLFHLLSGRRPRVGQDLTPSDEIGSATLLVQELPSAVALDDGATAIAHSLTGDLDAIVLKALRRRPEKRYSSVGALADDLRRHLEGQPVEARRPTVAYRSVRFLQRHKLAAGAASLAISALVLGFVGTAWQARVAARERDRAMREAQRSEAVKDFLLELFSAADPAQAKGEEVTARELLERGTARVDDLGAEPEIQAEMLTVLGGVYRRLGNAERAQPLLERALGTRQAVFSGDHAAVAESLNRLGEALGDLGNYKAAEVRFRQAMEMRQRLFGGQHPVYAESLNDVGWAIAMQGDFTTGGALYRRALEIRRQTLGPDHGDIAMSLHNVGLTLHNEGRFAEAESYLREALDMRKRLLGEEHPLVALSLVALASPLGDLGRLDDAARTLEEALELQQRLLGAEHPSTTTTLNNLAVLRGQQGRYRQAEPRFREVVALDRKQLGEEHPFLAMSLGNHAEVLAELGEFEAAEPLFAEALEILRRAYGGEGDEGGGEATLPVQRDVARILGKQGRALRLEGRLPAAERAILRAVEIYATTPGTGTTRHAWALSLQAWVELDSGEVAAAVARFRTALEVQRDSLPATHPDLADTLLGLGHALIARGEAGEASDHLRAALAIYERARSDSDPRVIAARRALEQIGSAA